MKTLTLPQVDKPISRLALGCSGGAFSSGGEVSELIEAALAAGINCLDTAREYGGSEAAIGRWLKGSGNRERVVIASKCCHPAYAFLPRVGKQQAADDLHRSLEALGTDRIDIYFLHRDNPAVPVGAIVDFLNAFREEGKIGAFGGSNWSARRIAEANAYAERHGLTGFTVSSPHYSLGVQRHDPWGNGCRTVTGPKHAAERDFYRQTRLPLFAWSSLSGGVLSGKLKGDEGGKVFSTFGFNTWWGYGSRDNLERLRRCERLAKEKEATVSQIALAWLLTDELLTVPIIGVKNPNRLAENVGALEIALTPKERAWLNLEGENR